MSTTLRETIRETLRFSTIRGTLLDTGGGGGGGSPIPANAILDRDGNPILDRDGNYILSRT